MAILSAGLLHTLCAMSRLYPQQTSLNTETVHYKYSKVMVKRGVLAHVCASLQLAHAARTEEETGRETIVHSHGKL